MESNSTTRQVSPQSANLSISTADNLRLRIEAFGHVRHRPIVFAHGFGQTRHAWQRCAQELSERGNFCLTADGRGHGDSDWQPDGLYDFDLFVDDLLRISQYAGQKPVLVGASMGGLLGMVAHAEADAPVFSAMVLVDITPRWEIAGVERIMRFMRAHPEGFDSIEAAQMAVMHYLPHREPKSPERLQKLLKRMKNGRLRWHWDPALLETVAPAATQYMTRVQAAARRLKLPVLLISGGRSDVVSDQTIAEFQSLVPQATHQRIDHATHMVAGDDHDLFTEIIANYIHSLDQKIHATSALGVRHG